MWAAQNPELQQLLQMWRAGRVSLLAVVLNYVLSSVSTKLGAGAPGSSALCLCCTQTSSCGFLLTLIACGSLSICVCMSHINKCMHGAFMYCRHAPDLQPHGTLRCIAYMFLNSAP